MLLNDRWRYVRLIELLSTHAQVIHVKRRVTLTFHSAFVMHQNEVRTKCFKKGFLFYFCLWPSSTAHLFLL